MATLNGKDAYGFAYSLEVTSVTPSLDGPRDAYDVALSGEGVELFRSQFNVHGWQLGHYHVYRIARAFQHASRLVDATLDFALGHPEGYKEPIMIQENVGWLEVLLWARTVAEEARVFVEVFVQPDFSKEAPSGPTLDHLIGISFYCSLPAAEEFGKALEGECTAAEDLREKLGIPAAEE